MSSNRHRLRKRLQQACGEPALCALYIGWEPEAARPAIPWSTHTTHMPQLASRSGESKTDVSFPWTLPEGLLFWRQEWGCRWIVHPGVKLPRPEGSATRKLQRLRVDPPQGIASPHRRPVPAADQPGQSRPPRATAQEDSSPGELPAVPPSPAAKPERKEVSLGSSQQTGTPPRPSSGPEETAAGIPQLYLDLAQAWREHPSWQSPAAALLCPVDPAQHSLQELAVHLAGALAHLEKSESLVVDFRPQATGGPWRQRSGGLRELLDAEQPLQWESMLRATAYQRVWYLPQGRRGKLPRRRASERALRWQQLLQAWKERFAIVLILGPQATAVAPEQIPSEEVLCCLLAVVDASSRQAVLAGKKRLEKLTGSWPLCFALPDDSWPTAPLPRAA